MKYVFILVVLTLFPGCALFKHGIFGEGGGNQYSKTLNGLMDQPESESIEAFGAPDRTFDLDNGGRILTWNQNKGRNFRYWCKTEVTVDQSKTITGIRAEGNHCY